MTERDTGGVVRALTDDEALLLEPIVDSFSMRPAANNGAQHAWPVWDFVKRRFWEVRPDGPDPHVVLSGIPVAGKRLDARDTPYRLYWLGQVNDWETPRPDTTIGLTIAGLYAYGTAASSSGVRFSPAAASLADELVGVVAGLAQQASGLTPTRDRPVQGTTPLVDHARHLARATRNMPLTMPVDPLVDLLRHEFPWLNVTDDGIVDLARSGDLRRFRTMLSAREYVASAMSLSAADRPAPTLDQLALPRAIDYLTAALESSTTWPGRRRVLSLSAVTDAANLALDAGDRDAFAARVSSFCTILARMEIPDSNGTFSSDRSVNRLQELLEHTLPPEVFHADVLPALADVRAVVDVRNGVQHSASKNMGKMTRAYGQLGLEPMITDWSLAWRTVAGRAADAFDRMARDVRSCR